MIQPLDASVNSWHLLWIDLEEPVPSKASTEASDGLMDYYLPTCVLVTTGGGKPICPPEISEELDQPRTEQLLGRLFEEHGTPDRLTIAESSDWDTEAWRSFAQESRVEISFGTFPSLDPAHLKQAANRISQRLQSGFHSPQTVARGLVSTARRLRSSQKKAALLRKALERDSDCSLAHIELADQAYQAGHWNDCRQGYSDLIKREERRWKGESPDWWNDGETRPYLRALYGHAMTEWQRGGFARTAEDLGKILTLNPADNQGVRFLISLVFLLADEDERALKSIQEYELRYPDDYCEPAFLFGAALTHWRTGSEEASRSYYRKGMLRNLYIAPMLLDLPTPHSDLWKPNDRSDSAYARDFIQSYATLWDRDPAALRCVREIHGELCPEIERLISLRSEMNEWQDQRYDKDFKERWKSMMELDESLSGGADRS
jgi:tetratricopeptide (TPR) repeat protein